MGKNPLVAVFDPAEKCTKRLILGVNVCKDYRIDSLPHPWVWPNLTDRTLG